MRGQKTRGLLASVLDNLDDGWLGLMSGRASAPTATILLILSDYQRQKPYATHCCVRLYEVERRRIELPTCTLRTSVLKF
jgi:hypothetical protein